MHLLLMFLFSEFLLTFNLAGKTVNKHSVSSAEVGALVAVVNETNHIQLVDLNTGATWLVQLKTCEILS